VSELITRQGEEEAAAATSGGGAQGRTHSGPRARAPARLAVFCYRLESFLLLLLLLLSCWLVVALLSAPPRSHPSRGEE